MQEHQRPERHVPMRELLPERIDALAGLLEEEVSDVRVLVRRDDDISNDRLLVRLFDPIQKIRRVAVAALVVVRRAGVAIMQHELTRPVGNAFDDPSRRRLCVVDHVRGFMEDGAQVLTALRSLLSESDDVGTVLCARESWAVLVVDQGEIRGRLEVGLSKGRERELRIRISKNVLQVSRYDFVLKSPPVSIRMFGGGARTDGAITSSGAPRSDVAPISSTA